MAHFSDDNLRIRFLFWNCGRRNLLKQIRPLAQRQDCSVVAIAESVLSPAEIVQELRTFQNDFEFQPSDSSRILVFSRNVLGRVQEQFVDPTGRLTIRRFDLPNAQAFLLGVVHLQSKLHWSSEAQSHETMVIASDICNAERDVGHSRTIVMGDFNMNPYDLGIVSRHCFNAVMTRREIRRNYRIVSGRRYPVFYNPMWRFFGDNAPNPSGTFYYRGSEPTSHP